MRHSAIILILSVFLLSGCSRPENSAADIRISIPQGKFISKGAVSQAMTGTLIHISLNVTGDGLSVPIVQNFDSCHDCPNAQAIPTTILLPQIPNGSKLFQILAVTKNSSTNTMNFYYGDVTQNITASTTVSIAMSPVGSGTVISGNVGGRYLTGTDSGPTDIVDIKYQPPKAGASALIVDSAHIANGWFNFFMLSGVSFKYVLRKSGAVLWDTEVSLDSAVFDPANDMNQRVKAFVPVHTQSRWINGTTTYLTAEPRISVWGYWGSTGKYVCLPSGLSSTTEIKKYASSNLASAPALTINHTTSPGAVTPSASQLVDTASPLASITVKGGATMSASCGSYSDTEANRFTNFLKVVQKNIEQDGHDSGPGFRGIFISNSDGYPASVNGNPKTISGRVLPGIASTYNQIYFYKRVGSDEFRLDYPDCSQISTGTTATQTMGYVLSGSPASIGASGEFSLASNVNTAEVLSGVTGVLCPAKDGVIGPVGYFLEKWSFQNGYYAKLDGLDGTFSPNSCFEARVALRSYQSATMISSGHGTIPLSTTISGLTFHSSDGTCASVSDPISVVSLTNTDAKSFFIRTPSSNVTGSISAGNFVSNGASVDGSVPANLTVDTSTGSASQISLSFDISSSGTSTGSSSDPTYTFTNSCNPVRVTVKDVAGRNVSPGISQNLSAAVVDNPAVGSSVGAIYSTSDCMSGNLGTAESWDASVGAKYVYVFGALSNSIDNSMSVNLGVWSEAFNAIFP